MDYNIKDVSGRLKSTRERTINIHYTTEQIKKLINHKNINQKNKYS